MRPILALHAGESLTFSLDSTCLQRRWMYASFISSLMILKCHVFLVSGWLDRAFG